MVRHKLVPTLALLFVLGAPAPGGAEAPARPRVDEPRGRLAAALIELRDRIAALWPDHGAGTPTAIAAEDGSDPAPGGGDGHGGLDPNGSDPPTGDPEPARQPAS